MQHYKMYVLRFFLSIAEVGHLGSCVYIYRVDYRLRSGPNRPPAPGGGAVN
jgi:hypothetical protein